MATTIIKEHAEIFGQDTKILETASIVVDISENPISPLPSLSIKTYSFSPTAVYKKRRNVQAILCQAEALIARELCSKDKR